MLEILAVAALRQKGLSLQKIRRVLRWLRRELGQRASRGRTSCSRLYLLTDGNSVYLDEQPERILVRLAEVPQAMCLSDLSAARTGSAVRSDVA